MKSVFIIKDRLMKPYMVVTVLPGGTEFKPLTSSARDLVKFFEKDYLNTPIKKSELVQALDATMEIEGPMPLNGVTRAKISALTSSSDKEPKVAEGKMLPVISLSEVVLTDVTDEEFFNVVSYKASAFLADRTRTSIQYEIKGVRAVWDASLAIPGTDRRGGWRCPVGTRYGGQITDRFGRSCGWGVARRIANEIADLGERIENVDDRRRGRRLERRNNRMARRLAQDAGQGGRVERGARRIAEALDGGNAPSAESIKPQRRQGPVRRRGLVDEVIDGFRQGQQDVIGQNRRPRPRAEAATPEAPVAPRRPRQPRLRPSEQRRMEREIVEPNAPRTAEPAAPRRPRRGRDLPNQNGMRGPERVNMTTREAEAEMRRLRQIEAGERLTPQQARDAQVSENFPDYVNRKYGEYARNVRQINEGGGRAGMLTRREWYEINKDNLRGAWGNVHRREAPLDFEPPAPRRARRAPARAVSTITLGSKWTKNNDGSWERDGYKLTMTVGRDGVIERMVIEAPDGGKNEMLYGGGRGTETLNNAVDTFLQTAKQLAEGRRARNENGGRTPSRRPAGRAPRRRAATANAARSATRRPKPADVPEARPARPARATRRVNSGPTDAFNHAGVRFRGMDAARRRADMLALRENEPHHVVKYNEDLALYILNDAQLDQLRNNGSLDGKYEILERRDPPAPTRVRPPQPPARPNTAPEPPSTGGLSEPKGGALRKRRTPARGVMKARSGNDNKIAEIGSDGLNEVKAVPVGNKGISTKEQAIAHIGNGGEMRDVPDDFLLEALNGNSGAGKRYERSTARGGVNGAFALFKDNQTGKRFFVKYDGKFYRKNEDLHEVIGNNIAGRIGFNVGEARFAGPLKDYNGSPVRAIIFEHAENYLDGRVRSPQGGIDFSDRVRATLFDYMLLNTDRHGGNYFEMVGADGKIHFVPIDPSLGFQARQFTRAHDDADGFKNWIRSSAGGGRNGMMRRIKEDISAGRKTREDLVLEIAAIQEQLRKSERAKPLAVMLDDAKNAAGGARVSRDIPSGVAGRQRFLLDKNASDIVDLILSGN